MATPMNKDFRGGYDFRFPPRQPFSIGRGQKNRLIEEPISSPLGKLILDSINKPRHSTPTAPPSEPQSTTPRQRDEDNLPASSPSFGDDINTFSERPTPKLTPHLLMESTPARPKISTEYQREIGDSVIGLDSKERDIKCASGAMDNRRGSVAFFLCALFLMVQGASATTNHVNYGVIFQSHMDVKFSTEHWKHTFMVGIPDIRTVSLIPWCPMDQPCQKKNLFIRNLNILRQLSINAYNETSLYALDLIPELESDAKRKKKALFPFLGDALSWLTGTPSQSDLNGIRNHVNRLQGVMSTLTSSIARSEKQYESYNKAVNERFENIMESIETNQKAVSSLATDTRNSIADLEDTMYKTQQIMANEINHVSYLQQHASQFLEGIIQLAQNKLPPTIIDPKTLKYALTNISNTLRVEYSNIELITTDINYYYKYAAFDVNRIDNNLLITIKFPLTSNDQFTAYKVHLFPVPVNISHPGKDATMLDIAPDNFLISDNMQTYTELSESALQTCKGTDIIICPFQPLHYFLEKDNCIANIFFDKKDNIEKFCNFKYMRNELKPHFLPVGNQNVIIYQISKIILTCKNNVRKTIKGCNFCLLKVDCGCTISTDDILFQNHLTDCEEDYEDKTATKVYPVNLPVLTSFFNDSQVMEILSNSTFSDPVDVIIPHIQIFSHKMAQYVANDHKLDLNLKKIAQRTKNNSIVYTHLAEVLANGEMVIPEHETFDYKLIILICSGTLTVLNSIILFLTIRKLKTLMTLLLLLQGKANGLPDTFHYEHINKDSTPSPDTTSFLDMIKAEHINIIICIIILLFTLYLIARISYKRNNDTKLIMEISNGATCVIVTMLTLPLCHSYYTISYPNEITDIVVNGHFFPDVTGNWSKFMVIDRASNKSVSVPKRIRISVFKAFRLKRILHANFILKIRIVHNSISFVQDIVSMDQILPPRYDHQIALNEIE